MIGLLKQLLGYALASVCALVVDIAILWMLVQLAGWSYLAAAVFSFIAGAAIAYQLSVSFAFREHRLIDRRLELATFIAIGTGGLAINIAVIFVLVSWFELNYLVAKGVAASVTFACNFAARRHLLFVPRNQVSR